MKNIFKTLWNILEVIIIVYVIFLTSCILFRNKFGFTQFGKYTISPIDGTTAKYVENTKSGDLLIVKSSDDLVKGDRIYYYATVNDRYVIRTGIVENVQKDDYNSLYTIDTLVTGDKKTKLNVAHTRTLGKYANSIGSLGSIMSFLVTRIGFLLFVLLPILLVFVYQIYEFVIVLNYERKASSEPKIMGKEEKTDGLKEEKPMIEEKKEEVDVL